MQKIFMDYIKIPSNQVAAKISSYANGINSKVAWRIFQVESWYSGFIHYFCNMDTIIAIYSESEYNDILR